MKLCSSRGLSTFLAVWGLGTVANANVILQGFYWDVPSPSAGKATAPWWWDHLASQAHALRLSGFSAIWIPPVTKGASGGYSDGYDPFDDYDIGSKNQKGTVPTRYGNREALEHCCATFRSNGIDVYCDLVENHRDGDPGDWHYSYLDAYGNAGLGRFGKSKNDFHPNVPQDPNVPQGTSEDFGAFGRDLAPINGPSRWIFNGLNNAGDWLTKALDLQGYRLDDVKGISTDWLKPFLGYGAMNGKFAVGEFYDGNLGKVQNWVTNMMGGRASAFDFPLRYQLRDMCNSPKTFNMASLDHAGLAGNDPFHAVTFVENHDTDRSEPITQNKALAYAYILTSEGYPTVFYRDYSTDAGCYGLKVTIDNLIWIHENLASGTTTQRWKNNLVFVYERNGGKHLLVGLNNNIGYDYKLTCATGFGPKVKLHDYTGHAPDVVTDANGNVSLDLPPAINGQGYVAYAPLGLKGTFTAPLTATTQEYNGASDLDIQPADASLKPVCRVQALANRPLTAALTFDTTGWNSKTVLALEIDSPAGKKLASRNFTTSVPQGSTVQITVPASGWYTFRTQLLGAPGLKSSFNLRATYTAPQ
jgi:alpha-amylase